MGKREEVGKWDGRRVGGEKDLFSSWANVQAPAEASRQAHALLHSSVPAFTTALFALLPITTTKTLPVLQSPGQIPPPPGCLP